MLRGDLLTLIGVALHDRYELSVALAAVGNKVCEKCFPKKLLIVVLFIVSDVRAPDIYP